MSTIARSGWSTNGYPEEAYRAARTNVLQGFLKRDRIFQTAAYRRPRRQLRAGTSNVRWRSCVGFA